MSSPDVDQVRLRLGEVIPGGGSENDTMFTDAQVQGFLDGATGDQTEAALAGWRVKAARYANLVTVSEGNSTRQMSDLHTNALAMVKQLEGEVLVVATPDDLLGRRGRVVIGEISRSKRYG